MQNNIVASRYKLIDLFSVIKFGNVLIDKLAHTYKSYQKRMFRTQTILLKKI